MEGNEIGFLQATDGIYMQYARTETLFKRYSL